MAMAIAYEAGSQPLAGQQAAGQVILNRLWVPRFPKSVCGVVFDGAAPVMAHATFAPWGLAVTPAPSQLRPGRSSWQRHDG